METLQSLLKECQALYEAGDYQAIIDLLPNDVLVTHTNADLYCWLGLAWERKGEIDKAIAEYDKAIECKDDYVLGYLNKGLQLSKKGEIDKAIENFNKVIELKDDYALAYNSRALAWSEKQEYDKAIADFTKAIELDDDFAEAYNNRSVMWNDIHEYDKAIVDCNKAIKLKSGYVEAYNNRGIAWDSKGEYDKAIADYNMAISLKDNYVQAYSNRGVTWSNKGEFDKAIEDYNKAIELKDDYVEAYNNRAIVWDSKGEYDKAITDYNMAILLKDNYAQAYNNRGITWNNKEEYDKAIIDLNKAIELKNDYAYAYNNRGVGWENKGEYEKAIADYLKAIELNADYKTATNNLENAKERLLELKKLQQSNARDKDKKLVQKLEKEIEAVIKSIRIAAKSDVQTVVHYTKVSVAEIYVKNLHVKMQYSNAIYMNDPMEGQILFEYLNDKEIEEAYKNGERRTETSVYLGSFMPAEEDDNSISHKDELVMWRTYGKDEQGKEAAGCNVILNSNFFKASLQASKNKSLNNEAEQELLTVIYVKKQESKKVLANDGDQKIETAIQLLKKHVKKLITLKKKYDVKEDFYREIENLIFKQLSKISFLFKSADYEFEREVRVITYVPRGSNLIKERNQSLTNGPGKRFFIESENDILPYVQRIYLGPKVDYHQQWSLYFDYEIRQRAKELENISPVPYKINPSNIEIIKSECKFQ